MKMATLVREIAEELENKGYKVNCVAEPKITDPPEITISGNAEILIYFYHKGVHLYSTKVGGEKWENEGIFKYDGPEFPGNLYQNVEGIINDC
jgi:hypothetical protein